MWAYVNNKLGKNNTKKQFNVSYVNDAGNGNVVTGDKNMADYFNRYFCSVGKNITESINKTKLANQNSRKSNGNASRI